MRIFISYPSKDLQFAKDFADLCREHGHDPFVAQLSQEKLTGNQGFLSNLCAEIQRCDAFILCVTENSLDARFQKSEWDEANTWEKETPLIVYRGDLLTEYFRVFPFSRGVQWFRFDDPAGREQICKFLAKPPEDLPEEERFQLMQRVVIEAGMRLIARHGRNFLSGRPVILDDRKNFATDVDVEMQDFIVDVIQRAFPDDPILAEEETEMTNSALNIDPTAEVIWTLDSLDGTLNFVAGDDRYCCAVGLMRHGEPYLGAIFVPSQLLLYTGGVERQATVRNLGDGAVRTLKADKEIGRLSDCWTLTHISSDPENLEHCFQNDIPRRLHENVRRVWMWGSGLISLTALIRGSHHLFVQRVTYPWDIVPGLAILHAAGGVSTCWPDPEPGLWRFSDEIKSGVIAACNQPILDAAVKCLTRPAQ